MASFDYRLNPLYAIKECSSCGTLYTGDCGCSKGSLEDKILVPIPDLSQRPLKIEKICLDCGDPVHGLYCRQCALIRKTLEEVFQDFQDTSKSSDDDTNFVNQEPFVVKQGPDCGGPHETFQCQPMNKDYYHEQNPCYDSNYFGVDQFQPPQYTVNHRIFNAQNSFLNSQNKLMEQITSMCDMVGQFIQKKEEEKRIEEEQATRDRYWKIPVCYDDDNDEESSFPLKDIIFELPQRIKKISVRTLVQIPSESEDSFDGECDLPPYDDSSKNHDLTFSNPLFDIDEDFTSSDESFSEEDSSPVKLTLPPNNSTGNDDINLDPEGDILFLESLLYDNSSPRPPEEFNFENPTESFSPSPIPVEDSDSLMEEIDIFSYYGDKSYHRDSTIDVVEDIPIDVPNILPTHLALQLDFNFISLNDLGSDLNASSPSKDRNKIYDPGICIEVESTKILATLFPVINTLLQFSSENEDKVFNHGVLAYKEKSPPSSSHRGLKAFQLSPESPMLIHGDNTPNLGVRHPHFYPP
ncbi:hypothetical protein Tco_1098408 [Tanacetum coccineum]